MLRIEKITCMCVCVCVCVCVHADDAPDQDVGLSASTNKMEDENFVDSPWRLIIDTCARVTHHDYDDKDEDICKRRE